jgi:hypothetical protein
MNQSMTLRTKVMMVLMATEIEPPDQHGAKPQTPNFPLQRTSARSRLSLVLRSLRGAEAAEL